MKTIVAVRSVIYEACEYNENCGQNENVLIATSNLFA
jgi:hypothetical protein